MRTITFLELVRMAKVLLLALLIMNELLRRRQFQHAIAALTVGVILQATIAITQTLMGAQLGLQVLGEATDADTQVLSSTSLEGGEFVYRAGGLIGHANLLAAYLGLFLPMAIALILSPVSRPLKALSLVAILVGPPALVLTLSRTGWVDFIVALAMVLVLGASHPASRRQFLFARVAIFAGIVITAVAASPLILKRLYEADPTSVQYRLEWIQTAKAMILDNPVFGVGLNTYVYMQVPYGKNKTPGELTEFYGDVWPVVHNAWLIVWSEQGTIGFIIWIAFHISVIAVAIRNLRIRDPMMHALGVGLFAGFVAIMIDGLASFFVREEATSRMFWIATAMILAIGYWRRLNEDVRALTAAPVAGGPRQSQVTALPDGRWLPARESLLR